MYSCLRTFCLCLLLEIHSIILYLYSSIQLYGCKCVNKLSSVLIKFDYLLTKIYSKLRMEDGDASRDRDRERVR